MFPPWVVCLLTLGCLITRAMTVVVAILVANDPLFRPLAAILAVLMAAGLVHAFARNNKVGVFGGTVWWHHLRLVHALGYMLYAILTLLEVSWAPYVLAVDLFVAFAALFYKKVILPAKSTDQIPV